MVMAWRRHARNGGYYQYFVAILVLAHIRRHSAAAAGIAFINSWVIWRGFKPYLVGGLKDLTASTDSGLYVLAGFYGWGRCWCSARVKP